MNEPPQWAYIVILVLLLFLSMIFSSEETAFLSVNKLKIKYLREKKNKKAARAEKILQKKRQFLTTSLIGNSLVNILISVILTAIIVKSAASSGVSLAVGIATAVILVFGEIIPKSAALVFAEPIALRFSGFILVMMYLLAPVVWLLSGFTGFLLKIGGVKNIDAENSLTDADLKDFFDSSEEEGGLHSDEHNVLEKILNYGDITVKNIMTPRPDIVSLQNDASPLEIIELSHTSRFSRFPVYGKDIDEIIGIFYIKDFLFSNVLGENLFQTAGGKTNAEKSKSGSGSQTENGISAVRDNGKFDLSKYLRKPVRVFENTELSKLQEIFKTEKQNMIIVIDEYGGTLGIATLEDLNEQIFGNIADEYDTDEAAADAVDLQNLKTGTDGTFSFTVSGNMRLSVLNEELSTSFFSEYYDTIGGLVMERAGEVPEIGRVIKIENYLFTVKKTDGNRITELYVSLSGENE